MIAPLRKLHFVVWRILAVVLPVGFCLAIVFRPDRSSPEYPAPRDFSFAIKKVTNSTAELTVDVKSILQAPSCVVYVSFGENDILVGKVDHRGSYHFNIPWDMSEKTVMVKLYDPIHHKEITRSELHL